MPGQGPERPNILYVMTDQQRWDSVSAHGRGPCRTPNLDRLAAEGARFDNAYTVCALCSPARASMLTGRYPHHHRMWNNCDMMQWAVADLPEDERLISQDLAPLGYANGFVGKWHCGCDKVPSDYGFEGMDVPRYGNPYRTAEYADYCQQRGLAEPKIVRAIDAGSWQGRPLVQGGVADGPPEACSAYFLAEYAIDMLERFAERRRRTGRPFHLFLSFWAPHHPCCPPEPYASMVDPDEVELWPSMHDTLAGKPHIQKRFRESFYAGGQSHTAETWRQLIAWYWGFTMFVDAQIGRVLEKLDALGLTDETAVLFSTDHGDMTGSHGGFWDKGEYFYEDIYHIPLIVRYPGAGPAGVVRRELVTNMDLAATALDLAGAPVPESHDARSLAPLLADGEADWPDDLMCEYHGHRYLYSQRMLRWDRYKYNWNVPDVDELYDLEADPHELTNRIDDPGLADVAEECRRRVVEWVHRTGDPLKHAADFMLAAQCGSARGLDT